MAGYGFDDDFMEAFDDVLDEMENIGAGGSACAGAYSVLKYIADGEGDESTILGVFDTPGANQIESFLDGVVGILIMPSLRDKYAPEVQLDMLMRTMEYPIPAAQLLAVFGGTLPEEAVALAEQNGVNYKLVDKMKSSRFRQEW